MVLGAEMSDTDRELLQAAAKAAGKTKARYVEVWNAMADPAEDGDGFDYLTYWNPLTSGNDTFRLMVDLGIGVMIDMQTKTATAYAPGNQNGFVESFSDDDYNHAAKRAVTRAAAWLGGV
jgi:hypothetical protein